MLIRQMLHYYHYHYHHWYFKDNDFKHKPYFCDGCHDLVKIAIIFNDAAIVSVKESGYRIHFWYMTKNNAMNLMESSNLNKNIGSLKFFLYIEIGQTTY